MIGRNRVRDPQVGKDAHPRMFGDSAEVEDHQREIDLGLLRLHQLGDGGPRHQQGCSANQGARGQARPGAGEGGREASTM